MTTFAILTGASRGLGEGLARELIERGITLATIARNTNPQLEQLAKQRNTTLHQISADLTDASQTERAVGELAEWVPVDATQALLINNAGTVAPVANTMQLSDARVLSQAFALNVTSLMVLCAEFLRVTASGSRQRRILNISSGAGRAPVSGWAAYCSTKAAVDMYTRVLAQEHPEVKAASMAPGVIDTAMQAEIRAADPSSFPGQQRFLDLHEQGQLADPTVVGKQIIHALLHPDFGQTTLDDIRHHLS